MAYQIDLELGVTYPGDGVDRLVTWIEASETGATAGVYVHPTIPNRVRLPAGATFNFAESLTSWGPATNPWTAGLIVYNDDLSTVLIDDLFTNTSPGSAGIYSAIENPDTPFVMPYDGWIAMLLNNASGNATVTTDFGYLYLEIDEAVAARMRVGPLAMKPAYSYVVVPYDTTTIVDGTYNGTINAHNEGSTVYEVVAHVTFDAPVPAGIEMALVSFTSDLSGPGYLDPTFDVIATVPVTPGATSVEVASSGPFTIPSYGSPGGVGFYGWLVHNESGGDIDTLFIDIDTTYVRYAL